MRTQTGTAILLEDYRPSDYQIDKVDLDFSLDAQETLVTSILSMRRAEGVAEGAPLALHGDELELVSMAVNDTALSEDGYELSADGISIYKLPASDVFTLKIVTKINPTANKKLMGLYRTSGNFCTQCEAEGFRRITYYLDRPDILSVFTVRIEGDSKTVPLLLSNGNCTDKGALENGRHFAVWHDPHPKPAYLFALFAGDLGVLKDRFKTRSGRDVALEIYVEHGKEPRAAYAMDSLIRSMKWDEEVYGCEYDLDIFMIVAVSDFNMGAMENKGLNVFNDKYVLADPETATDQDYANIEAIIAHEYFHNWTGNRITCRDWFQLCLKEGLTVYRDHSFSADMRSAPVKRIAEVRGLRAHQFPEDAGPLAHPVRPRRYSEINNFYTSTVYEKGSEVVGMFKTIVGQEGYKRALDLYFERHDGDAATIEDFIKCFEDATGADLKQFSLWYDQAGTPNLAIETNYDEAHKRFTVNIAQSLKSSVVTGDVGPMHIPVRFGLVGPQGNDLAYSGVTGADVTGDVIHVREPKHSIHFEGVEQEPVISLLRGFSAPVTIIPERADSELAFLARHDNDEFARWEALSSLAMRQLRQATHDVESGKAVKSSPELTTILHEILSDETLEPAYRALCLSLPSEADIAREIGSDINPDAIYTARSQILDDIAKECLATLQATYAKLNPAKPFVPDATSAGIRSLRNTILGLIVRATGDVELAAKHFSNADNMTDRADALSVLALQAPDAEETALALETFRARYADNPIVMDKWFAIQAMIPGGGALERVEQLSKSDSFSWENPNRVRALIGSFSVGNPTGFNRVDGAGYRFLCDATARLDDINPQVAARLITAMRSWRNLEKKRSDFALEALKSLLSKEKLSRDVRDILERTLA
ncbi:aminopeptidase N [Ahrensia kielensis]|uniref:aminopeptidase N n=1 Tax=Ahrensia kielensis TaxID=76980 RepID=UPI00035F2A94|nr:aminopeptidase N [Ahrensia kielensis]